ncbi:MAG: hypothetical protein GF316_08255 [Candidatus Lokiarchaeota archaeon]|nr:hypothetical protein [Candidatus Lokiarchaeota archaeon]
MVKSDTRESRAYKFSKGLVDKLQFLKEDYYIDFKAFSKKSFITISQINSSPRKKKTCIYLCLNFQVAKYSLILFEIGYQSGELEYNQKFSIEVDGSYSYEIIIDDLRNVIEHRGDRLYDPNFPL